MTLCDEKQTILQLKDEETGNWQALIINIHSDNLFKKLKKLKNMYELIIYTYLPMSFLTLLIE